MTLSARFVTREQVAERFKGKTVAIVGSAPSVLKNAPGVIDSHDIVVRVNNYKLIGEATGKRTDVHYSFYGTSIRVPREQLQRDGVTLCMSKLPDARPIECDWHKDRGKEAGIDYRYIYRNRASWWFCDTYIPTSEVFLDKFELLGRHQPTTGFAAILDLFSFECARLYLTGFDFFASQLHNVNEPWPVGKNQDDPIRHMPELEAKWVGKFLKQYPSLFTADDELRQIFERS